jgi:predicted cupin superfamily sugar epimerase
MVEERDVVHAGEPTAEDVVHAGELTAEDVVRLLDLEPLEPEGGFFAETYRCPRRVFKGGAGSDGLGNSAMATAIYYLLTPEQPSRIHRLPSDEIFHFYLGDPVEQLQLAPGGGGRILRLGIDLVAGQRPQILVPARTWQGARLVPGGRFALLGTTMAPGFEPADHEGGERESLLADYAEFAELIRALSRG